VTEDHTIEDRTSDGPTEEIWTFAGRRELNGKKYHAWQDGHRHELYYAKVPAITIGGRYTVSVTRQGERVIVHGKARYTGQQVDNHTRREMEALDTAAMAILAAKARDRKDARRKALDDAIQPLADIAAKLKLGHERDAFLAYVIRRLTHGR
jgi:hypothetical protein